MDCGFSNTKGVHIGINEWTKRLFYAQGAVDLYLGEMRRIDDAQKRSTSSPNSKQHITATCKDSRGCRDGKCGHYPRLELVGFEARNKAAATTEEAQGATSHPVVSREATGEIKSSAGGGKGRLTEQQPVRTNKKDQQQGDASFVVTKRQVKEYLSRPGAPTDSFAHPVLYARRKLRMLTVDWGCIGVNYSGDADEDYYAGSGRGDPFVYERPDMDPTILGSDDEEEETLLNRGSTARQPDGVFALSRSVLRLTPKLENLSFTGIFYECFSNEMPVFKGVRFMSVGPLTRPSTAGLCLQDVKLPAMEKLRICGDILGRGPATHIGGKDGLWPSLRVTQWDFGHKHIGINPEEGFLMDLVNIVQGRKRQRATQPDDKQQALSPSRQPPLRRETLRGGGKREDLPSRFVDARFHPAYLQAILNMAPSAEIRAAWIDGLPVSDAPHRVRLSESQAARKPDAGYFDPDQDYEVFRRDSVQWWEERALELEQERVKNCSATG